MSSYTTNEIRGGMKLLIDGDPYAVIENEYVKPGKGQAFNRIKVRNLRSGRTVEKSYRSGESIEAADVMDVEMQYLYKDGDFWAFMNPENFEQLSAGEAAVGDAAKWMKDGIVCIITLWNGVPLVVTPPPHIDLKVVETDPGLKGDTATGGQKVAKLETGASVRVPLFINEGEVLRIDTRSGESIEAADVMDVEMQYLYKDGDFWAFMNPENFEQLSAGEAAVGDAAKWMKDGIVCIITLWNGVPLVVTPPPHIDLKVVETDPGLKGDTATGGQKVAKLETGAQVRVPLFINEGELLRIDTRSGEYVSRAKG